MGAVSSEDGGMVVDGPRSTMYDGGEDSHSLDQLAQVKVIDGNDKRYLKNSGPDEIPNKLHG